MEEGNFNPEMMAQITTENAAKKATEETGETITKSPPDNASEGLLDDISDEEIEESLKGLE